MADPGDVLTAARRRYWRARAAGRRRRTGSAAPGAIRALRRGRREDLDDWMRRTHERHARYRHEHPPAAGAVAMVCVSRRPDRLPDVVAAFCRQTDVEPELVLVANGPHWSEDAFAPMLRLDRASIVRGFESESLGTCLNAGMDATSARFVAKIDDDDHYGPGYLVDALRAHAIAGAGIVGKHTYYADVEGIEARQLRFPGHDFRYSSTLAGGTLVVDRDRVGGLRFEDRSLGEDRAFITECLRHGVSTYSADRFNFVQHRGADNTWRLDVERFLIGCTPVDAGRAEHVVDR